FKGVFLLLLYLFASSPLNLFHPHESSVIIPEIEEANYCELAVYYGMDEFDVGHDSHFSEIPIDCLWCDHHLQVDQQLVQWSFEPLSEFVTTHEILSFSPTVASFFFHTLTNKDPPVDLIFSETNLLIG